MDFTATPGIKDTNGSNTAIYRQRSSSEVNQNPDVSSANSAYRTEVPLYQGTGCLREDKGHIDKREGEPCRHPNQVSTNDNSDEMERTTLSLEEWLEWDMDMNGIFNILNSGVGEGVGCTPT